MCDAVHRIDLNRISLRWRHNGRDSVLNHQPNDCLLSRLFRRRSKKTSNLRVTGICAGNSLGTGKFPAQMANNAENVSVWWRHHVMVWRMTWMAWTGQGITYMLLICQFNVIFVRMKHIMYFIWMKFNHNIKNKATSLWDMMPVLFSHPV